MSLRPALSRAARRFPAPPAPPGAFLRRLRRPALSCAARVARRFLRRSALSCAARAARRFRAPTGHAQAGPGRPGLGGEPLLHQRWTGAGCSSGRPRADVGSLSGRGLRHYRRS
jgi:hypothetical protein